MENLREKYEKNWKRISEMSEKLTSGIDLPDREEITKKMVSEFRLIIKEMKEQIDLMKESA